MDHGAFDALTRTIAASVDSRRVAVRVLAGGVLSGLVASLALDESAEAKKHSKRRDGHEPPAQMHAAGKNRKKGKRKRDKHKHRKKPEIPPLPPGCQQCGECEMCLDGACVLDPSLDGVHCGDPRHPQAGCNVCRSGLCVSTCHYEDSICCNGECLLPCGDGKVINPATCQCDCPDGQWSCPDDSCVAVGECCPGTQRCGPTTCSVPGECCSTSAQCQLGCCPEGYSCHHTLGSCCIDGPPLTCTCPSGYHSESGLCVPD